MNHLLFEKKIITTLASILFIPSIFEAIQIKEFFKFTNQNSTKKLFIQMKAKNQLFHVQICFLGLKCSNELFKSINLSQFNQNASLSVFAIRNLLVRLHALLFDSNSLN